MAKRNFRTDAAPSRYAGSPSFPGLALFLIPFGLIFLLAGLAPMLGLIPWFSWYEMRDWRETKATLTQTSDQLTYEYDWEGHHFMQNTYSADDGEDQTSPGKAKFLAGHKPGEVVTAYVNPADPAEAVIMRDIDWESHKDDLMFGGIFIAVFGLVGAGCAGSGFYMLIRYIRQLLQYRRSMSAQYA